MDGIMGQQTGTSLGRGNGKGVGGQGGPAQNMLISCISHLSDFHVDGTTDLRAAYAPKKPTTV
eukprot:scaffold128953_cov18-Tisochrysis_lutea.AAC.3